MAKQQCSNPVAPPESKPTSNARPQKLRAGDRIRYRTTGGRIVEGEFIMRCPRSAHGPALNVVRFPIYAGLNGPSDVGDSTITDYDLARRGRLA